MPFVAAPNIVQVEIRATMDSQKIENRVMIDALGPVTPTVVDNITNVVSNWAQAEYFDHLPSTCVLREVVGTDLSSITGSQHTITPSGTVAGALAADPMPNEVSFCLSLRTGNRGRSARGRFYVMGLTKDVVTQNALSSGRANEFKGHLETLISDVSDGGWAWVIVSYISGGAPRAGGPVYFPITTISITDLIVDSQRKRKPGVGS